MPARNFHFHTPFHQSCRIITFLIQSVQIEFRSPHLYRQAVGFYNKRLFIVLGHFKISFSPQGHFPAFTDKGNRILQFRFGIQIHQCSVGKFDPILPSPGYDQPIHFHFFLFRFFRLFIRNNTRMFCIPDCCVRSLKSALPIQFYRRTILQYQYCLRRTMCYSRNLCNSNGFYRFRCFISGYIENRNSNSQYSTSHRCILQYIRSGPVFPFSRYFFRQHFPGSLRHK